MAELQVGVIGATLRGTAYEQDQSIMDLSASTGLQFYLKSPSGKLKTFTASLSTDGTDGRMEYVTTAATDLFEHGRWRLQGRVVFGTQVFWSRSIRFSVLENLTP